MAGLTYQQKMAKRFERWRNRVMEVGRIAKYDTEIDIIREWSWLYNLIKAQILPLEDVQDYDDLNLRNEIIDRAARILKDMAPYVRARKRIEEWNTQATFDYSKLSDEELDALILVSGKLIEGKVDG